MGPLETAIEVVLVLFLLGGLVVLCTERRPPRSKYVCEHNDSLCRRYGCPDDPNWKGDGCK